MYGVSSMIAPLRRVGLRKPGSSLLGADPEEWHYGPQFDPTKVATEYEAFSTLLAKAGAEIIWMDGDDQGNADSVFTYDASLMTPQGPILMAPGKALRAGEQELHRGFYEEHDIPIIGSITGQGCAEAGDTLWLDDNIIAIGRGLRTNPEGIRQLTSILRGIGVEAHVFDLPTYRGPDACLHLMSLVSLVDTRKALVCMPLLPVGLRELMVSMGYDLIEAPYEEFIETGTLSTNVLAVAPGQCIMLDGILDTRAVLEEAGIEVKTFAGNALCIGCEGGPTCLTRPLYRA